MTALPKILPGDAALLKAYREEIAEETLLALWRGKWRIVAALAASLVLASMALVAITPRYTAEATIQFDFAKEVEDANATIRTQPAAILDAAALVEGAARLIRSRATAAAVVKRLKLDQDDGFASESKLLRGIMNIRARFGLEAAAPAPSTQELATAQLMKQIVVATEPRSYLISVAATAGSPQRAATLANGVATEYLRARRAQRLNDDRSIAERELAKLALIYGARHPNYLRELEVLDQIQGEIVALENGRENDAEMTMEFGQSLIPADIDSVPSSPNIRLTFALSALGGASIGVWAAVRRRQVKAYKSAGQE